MRTFFSTVVNFLFKFIAFVLSLLFVVVTVVVILLVTAERKLLNPELYKRVLASHRIYDRIPELMAMQLVQSMEYNGPGIEGERPRAPEATEMPGEGENPLLTAPPEFHECVRQAVGEEAYQAFLRNERPPTDAEMELLQPCLAVYSIPGEEGEGMRGLPPFISNLTLSDWEVILAELFPAPWLQAQAESVIDQLFAYLEAGEGKASLIIQMDEFKQRLVGKAGVAAVNQLLMAQPPCTEEELSAFLQPGISPEKMPMCRPPDEILAQFVPMIQGMFQELAAEMPDQVDLIQAFGEQPADELLPPEGTPSPGLNLKLKDVRQFIRLSPLLPGALLLLIALFGVRSLKELLTWWGYPSFSAGMITLGFGYLALPTLNMAVNLFVMDRLAPQLSREFLQAGMEVVRSIVGLYAAGIRNAGFMVGGLGAVLLLASLFVKPKSTGG
jgi:hypothetical protein